VASNANIAPGPTIPKNATAQQAKFIAEIWPYVVRESRRTGIPVEVFIIQSGLETSWGTSWLYRNYHNPAGIGAFDASHATQFSSLSDGFATYGDRLMGHGEGGQGQFVKDVNGGASAAVLLNDLQTGPWAAGHYGGTGLTDTLASLYGTAGGSATKGTGGGTASGTSGSGGQTPQQAQDALSLQGLTSHIPVVGGLLTAATWPGKLAQLAIWIFDQWVFIVEVIGGFGILVAGVLIIMNDVGEKKAPEIVKAVAAA
jgi:hypothetical protein